MAGVNTSNWQYADWQEETTAAARLTKLAQHITEARQAAVATQHSEGRSQTLNTSYITGLERQLADLRAAVSMGAAFSGSSGIPVVARPQF
jgi:hypothetical protein